MQVKRNEALDITYLASIFREKIEAFYEDPENKRKFEEWKKQREIRLNESNSICEAGSSNNICTGSRSGILSAI